MNFTEIVLEMISDGEWHTFGEIYRATQHLIPPEHAVRRLQLEGIPSKGDMGKDIQAGKQRITGFRLNSLLRNDRVRHDGVKFESDGIGINRRIRKRTNVTAS